MDAAQIRKQLESRGPGDWKAARLSTALSGAETRYMPLLSLKGLSSWLGLSSEGEWLVVSNGVARSLERQPLTAGWVVLEALPGPAVDSLHQGLRLLGLPESALQQLRLPEIIGSGLASGIEYWATRALDWAEALGVLADLREPITKVSEARWASQGLRQRAGRLLKKR